MASRLAHTLGVPLGSVLDPSTAPVDAASGVASWLGAKPLAVLALTFGLGVGAGAIGMRLLAPAAPPIPRVEPEPVAVSVVDAGVERAQDADAGAPALHLTDAALRAPAAQNTAPPVEEDFERVLIERARASLARGRAAEALAVLGRHARSHPRGAFVEEREALRIQALLGLERIDDADRALAAFRARYPESLFGRALQRARAAHGE